MSLCIWASPPEVPPLADLEGPGYAVLSRPSLRSGHFTGYRRFRAPPIPDASALRAGGGADSKTILIGTKGIVVPHFGLRPRIRMSINGFTGIIPGASHTAFPPLEFRLPRNEESFVCSGIDNE